MPARSRLGRDGPRVAWPPAPAARSGAGDQTGALEPLEVRAHAVGMKAETLRELDRAGRAPQLAQQLEQARPGRLGERVLGGGSKWEVDHDPEFCTVALGKHERRLLLFIPLAM